MNVRPLLSLCTVLGLALACRAQDPRPDPRPEARVERRVEVREHARGPETRPEAPRARVPRPGMRRGPALHPQPPFCPHCGARIAPQDRGMRGMRGERGMRGIRGMPGMRGERGPRPQAQPPRENTRDAARPDRAARMRPGFEKPSQPNHDERN